MMSRILKLVAVGLSLMALLASCSSTKHVPQGQLLLDKGMHNPLVKWNKTPRLKSKDQVDNENAVRILMEEAQRNNGLITVDTAPHFIVVK